MLDIIFWVVVVLVVWIAWDTRQATKAQRKEQDIRNLMMETIDEAERKD